MKIAFLDCISWEYNVESVYQVPLGGTQSAVCYLSAALAQKGHDVFIINNTSKQSRSRGVTCLSIGSIPKTLLQQLDVLIEVNSAGATAQLKSALNRDARVIMWCQHAHDQPAIQGLKDISVQQLYDKIALLSDWQSQQFRAGFGIDASQIVVMRNAISPAFINLFAPDIPIITQKSRPPILAYTSTPFRGLNILLEVFPEIRRNLPGITLKIFSSMKPYFVSAPEDEYRHLYERCRELPGVEYRGALPQPELAEEMKDVSIWAYPNTFQETYCIAALEAMASGCRIVTSNWGALPETTAGFAKLVSVGTNWDVYKYRFIQNTIDALKELNSSNGYLERHLRRQVDYVNQSATWRLRAAQWVDMLNST